ncbi:MAG: AraC family transcriptional regulator [Clostridiales bacterium]|nr:AraC family transcriptional regulator [Clostridiales bacterium]
MLFFPFQPFEELIDLERFCRAKHFCLKNPTPENRAELDESVRVAPRLFLDGRDPWNEGSGKEDARFTSEDRFFPDGYHIALVRHPRYKPPGWHGHDFFELIYVYSGACTHYIGDEVLEMQAGDFCILPPNMVHAMYTDRDDSLIVNVLIRKSTFDQVFLPLISGYDVLSNFFLHSLYQEQNNAYLLFSCGGDPFIRQMVRDMYDEYISRKPYSPSILIGQLTQLLGMLLRHHSEDVYKLVGERKPCPVNISRMLRYIQKNLRSVTLGDLAREFSYSESRCSTLIKQATGRNFRDIVREEKAHRAACLLRESSLSPAAIMEQVGYYDMSQFYKSFRTVYHTTPIQYRKAGA